VGKSKRSIDPDKNTLQGWLRSNKSLNKIKQMNGWISPRLQIKFVLTPTTLEIYRPDNRIFATPIELEKQRANAEQRADAERQARLKAVPQLLQMGLSIQQVAQALSLTIQEVQSL
jgi:predicted transposase/invertase (TIGR01784 family)